MVVLVVFYWWRSGARYRPHEAVTGDGHAPCPFLVGSDLVAFDFAHTERLNLPRPVHFVGHAA